MSRNGWDMLCVILPISLQHLFKLILMQKIRSNRFVGGNSTRPDLFPKRLHPRETDNTRLNKYKNQLYCLEWHLAKDITVLEKLKLPHPPPCCLDTTAINSHYSHYKTIEIQDPLNPSQHCQGTLTPLPAAVVSVITLTNAMGHRVTNSEDATGLSSSFQL